MVLRSHENGEFQESEEKRDQRDTTIEEVIMKGAVNMREIREKEWIADVMRKMGGVMRYK